MKTIDITRNVRGALSLEQCDIIAALAAKVPAKGSILDICPGEGRSTVVLSTHIGPTKGICIYSVDTHITDPRSERALTEGTLNPFLSNLRTYQCMAPVVPVLAPPSRAVLMLNKRSVNLCVVQVPASHIDPAEGLRAGIEAAQHVVRKDGRVVVAIPDSVSPSTVTAQFGRDYKQVHQCAGLVVFLYQPNS